MASPDSAGAGPSDREGGQPAASGALPDLPPAKIVASPRYQVAFQAVKPFLAAAAVLVTGSVLVAAIFFTLLDLAWLAFLAGVLCASILAMVTKATRTERVAASRAERMGVIEYQLTRETGQREKLQAELAAADARLKYFDDSTHVMLAYVDQNTRYLYHNRAFRIWIGLDAKNIDGMHMREVLGRKVFAEIEGYLADVAVGNHVRYERTHKAPGRPVYRLAVQYLPQFGDNGKYAGFYMVMTDITEHRDLLEAHERTPAQQDAPPEVQPDAGVAVLTSESQDASGRILAAIDGNEFVLFCQRIKPLADGAVREHYEVLIRLLEEESGQVPPGAFFPLAEEYGLLPQLDRWVFAHVLEWLLTPVGSKAARAGAVCFINIAEATIRDPEFAEFVDTQLRRSGVRGSSVCLEIAESYLEHSQGDAVQFARAMKQSGCHLAISGFGRNRTSLDALKLFPVDYVKIDGGIVRQILAYPTFLGKVVAINRVAKIIGFRTIAEMVEDEATLARLRELKVDYAQGFGISRPQPMADLQ